MTAKNVPIMIAIQDKETELKVKTIEAKQEAENLLSETRKTVSRMRQEAREEADAQAKASVEEALAKTHAEAQKILESADAQVVSLQSSSQSRHAKAVELVLTAVTGNVFSETLLTRAKDDSAEPGAQTAQYVSSDGGSDVS